MKAWPVADGRCPCCGQVEPIWPPDLIVEAMQEWSESYGRAPSSVEWRTASTENPSNDQVVRVFGSFRRARLAAGLPARLPRSGNGSRWTKEQVFQAVLEWAFAHGQPPRAEEWRGIGDSRPTTEQVVHLFGGWNAAMVAAGYEPRHPRGGNRRYEGIAREAVKRYDKREAA